MRISALSERTAVSVATLKYYLREGLVPPGLLTGRTQASYDESHVERVRLVRALIESAGLSLGAVRQVLGALDHPPASRHDLLGAAQHALLSNEAAGRLGDAGRPGGSGLSGDEWVAQARALVEARGWECYDDDPLLVRLGAQLRAADAAGVGSSDSYLQAVADACEQVALADLRRVPADPTGAVKEVVVGTILTDPIVLTLRRLAQRAASARLAADGAPTKTEPTKGEPA
jgi:DNA-binding transcriptional MerR regulator